MFQLTATHRLYFLQFLHLLWLETMTIISRLSKAGAQIKEKGNIYLNGLVTTKQRSLREIRKNRNVIPSSCGETGCVMQHTLYFGFFFTKKCKNSRVVCQKRDICIWNDQCLKSQRSKATSKYWSFVEQGYENEKSRWFKWFRRSATWSKGTGHRDSVFSDLSLWLLSRTGI
jgi:hypothetical protein